MSPTTILFGLDGATYTVLDDLVRRGVMPYLEKFTQTGARGVLRSTVPPLTPPAWTSMITGRSPGHHGITNFLQYESPDSRYIRVITSREIRCETLWSILNRHGMRAGSLNFVAHNPAPKIDGYVIPGWVAWRWVKKYTHPAGLIDQLKEQIPGFDLKELAMDFQQENKAVAGARIENPVEWIDLHIRRERQWFDILKYQMEHDPCELVAVVFDGVDKLQHLMWEYLDPALEPNDPTPEFTRVRDRCWDYFRQIDDFLEQSVALAGDDGYVFVVSDHGFTGSHEILYINTWLEQHGYLHWKPDAAHAPEDSHELGDGDPYHLTQLDLARTRAYASSAGSNGIHIPVRGRRGDDGIDPSDYHRVRDELIHALKNDCRDPATGEPIITGIWTREEAFDGPAGSLAPDITVALRDFGFFSVLRGRRVLKKRPMVIGTHHPDGVLIGHGPGIRAGTNLEPMRMVDVAPSLLNALTIPIPSDLEGTVPNDLFTAVHRTKHPVNSGPPTTPPVHWASAEAQHQFEPEPVNEEGDAEVMARLKALGYIE